MIIDISEDGYTIEWTSMVTGERKNASIVQLIDAFEAEPRKHGHWVGIDDFPHETWECDRCGKIVETDEPPNYCENCGAKMITPTESTNTPTE